MAEHFAPRLDQPVHRLVYTPWLYFSLCKKAALRLVTAEE